MTGSSQQNLLQKQDSAINFIMMDDKLLIDDNSLSMLL